MQQNSQDVYVDDSEDDLSEWQREEMDPDEELNTLMHFVFASDSRFSEPRDRSHLHPPLVVICVVQYNMVHTQGVQYTVVPFFFGSSYSVKNTTTNASWIVVTTETL